MSRARCRSAWCAVAMGLLVGSAVVADGETVATDAVGDLSPWIELRQSLTSQTPLVKGNAVSFTLPAFVLLDPPAFSFRVESFRGGTVDAAPASLFKPWVSTAIARVADPIDPLVDATSDLRRVTGGPSSDGRIPIAITTASRPTTAPDGPVFGFAVDVGGKLGQVLLRKYDVWDFVVRRGDLAWPWSAGSVHDIVQASVKTQGSRALVLSLQIAAAPARLPASAGEPFFDFVLAGGPAAVVRFRWNSASGAWEAVLRKVGPSGWYYYKDVKSLVVHRSGATFTTTVLRADLQPDVVRGFYWGVWSGATVGPASDPLSTLLDRVPDGDMLFQPW